MDKLDLDMRQASYNRLQEYTNRIEDMYSSLRSFKHDYLNIMLSMSGYIEAGDMSGLRDYFDREIMPLNQKMSTNTSHLNQLINIKITELKSIISAKLLYATELNINVNIEIESEISEIPMDTVDLSRVLGIFLDNAIEAAVETENPNIRFAIIDAENEYAIIISNTFHDSAVPHGTLRKPTFSTKSPDRGIGLYNAHAIISKYNDVLWETQTTDTLFIQQIRIIKKKI